MDPDQHTTDELAELHERVMAQIGEAVPDELRRELDAMALDRPFRDGATSQEVRVAYAGLIGWLSGLFQGLQAAIQFQQLQGPPGLERGSDDGRLSSGSDQTSQHATGQYL